MRAVSPKEPSAAYHLMTQHRSTGCFHPAMYNLHNVYFPMHNVHFDFSGPTFHESIVMQPGDSVDMLTSQILSKDAIFKDRVTSTNSVTVQEGSSHAVTYNEKRLPRESRESQGSKPAPGSRKYPYRKGILSLQEVE